MLKRSLALLLSMVLLFSMAGCKEKPAESKPQAAESEPQIYWNIDGHTYSDLEAFTNTRQPEEDGLYHMRFFREGEVVELTCENRALVKKIDFNSLVALHVEDGKITAIADLDDVCTWAADNFYILDIDDNVITANSSVALSSGPWEFKFTPSACIYDVSPDAEIYGAPTELGIMDRVTVLMDKDAENVTHVFITQRFEPLPLFWRVDETYGQVDTWDAEKKCTTRVPDENGVYTIRMARDGQQVDVLCKDIEIVNKIDSMPLGEQLLGLRFDDEGFADNWGTAARSIRGSIQANQCDVTELRDDGITTTRTLPGSTQGAIWEGKFADDCRIYDTTGSSGYVGIEVDTLQLGDRVMVLCNVDGEIQFIYITNRPAEN